ncbi:arylsulfatase [Rhodococcus wratislaviensis]|uniref:Arylsulfatase n=2 Tax=Rhodococcus TaxID=1827 RepID=A0AB38FDW8_RHOWR|nr:MULTISPECIES: arylsulfatase [Rhodococcus]AII08569.1 arylsulfatase [Rhodococcus opacus]REE75135.1 arylsulfatase [Rhodococcus wratislaviensis]SPZ39837.1 arylsulfatase [Rhodococcus wratislaviensis]
MGKPFRGVVNVDIRDSVPDWAPFEPPQAPADAPNVVYVVLDDVGFSAMRCYGGPIETPNIDRIAANGVRYTQWHTTALCSPTRSCLLTGRNHTRNSMACITEAAIGFPNASGTIPPENGMLSEILAERGWNTYMVGKWHLCPTDEMNLAATRRNWPSGRGFERWYGFLGAETNQWYPDLVYDNHPVDQPRTPEAGYHLTEDITDKALEFIKDAKVIAPDKPFFLYYAPGACHAPHHAPKEWIEKFAGKFDMGYDAIREQTLARQKELGIVAADTELPPINPIGTPETRSGPEGEPFPELDFTRPWDTLNDDEKRLFARMAEVYAGFLAHADHHIGRLLDYLEQNDQMENTVIVVVSDNGASGEGGPNGSVNEMKFANGIPDDLAENLAKLDDLGGPKTYNHYPNGWAMAFNTPFKMWKRYEFNGGTADPCIISWPAGTKARNEIRDQYHHAIDLVPTVLDLLGVDAPETIKGHVQSPFDGVSMRSSIDDKSAPSERKSQFYSMLGSRSIWHEGWKAVTTHPTIAGWGHFNDDEWELYHTDVDRAEVHNLAAEHPGKLRELVNIWFAEAGANGAFPLDDRSAVEIMGTPRPQLTAARNRYVYYPDVAAVSEWQAVSTRGRSFVIGALVDIPAPGAEGVLFAIGSRFGGHALYVKDNRLHYVNNFVGSEEQMIVGSEDIPTGTDLILSASFDKDGQEPTSTEGILSLFHADRKVGEGRIKTQMGAFAIAGAGLYVGRHPGEPITEDYPGESPHRFTGGTINRVAVDVSGEPYLDLEREAALMLMRE